MDKDTVCGAIFIVILVAIAAWSAYCTIVKTAISNYNQELLKGRDYTLAIVDEGTNNSNKTVISMKEKEKYNIYVDEKTKDIIIEIIETKDE